MGFNRAINILRCGIDNETFCLLSTLVVLELLLFNFNFFYNVDFPINCFTSNKILFCIKNHSLENSKQASQVSVIVAETVLNLKIGVI